MMDGGICRSSGVQTKQEGMRYEGMQCLLCLSVVLSSHD